MIYRYDPGDVAVIHPIASFTDVETFLGVMGWEDIADVPFALEQKMFGAFFIATYNYLLIWSRRPITSLASTEDNNIKNSFLSLFGFQSGT